MLWDSTSVRTTSMPDRIAESNANALRLCCHHRIMGWNPFWMDVFAKLHYNHKKFLRFFPLLHICKISWKQLVHGIKKAPSENISIRTHSSGKGVNRGKPRYPTHPWNKQTNNRKYFNPLCIPLEQRRRCRHFETINYKLRETINNKFNNLL